jgi:hypothetical protein
MQEPAVGLEHPRNIRIKNDEHDTLCGCRHAADDHGALDGNEHVAEISGKRRDGTSGARPHRPEADLLRDDSRPVQVRPSRGRGTRNQNG